MRLLFVHGAGGFIEDQPLAQRLGAALGVPVELPRLPDDDMSVGAWTGPVRDIVSSLGAHDLVIAHSFGATILLHVLGDLAPVAPPRVALLAMPDWSPQGWDIADYDLPARETTAALTLHHCRDDEVVPFTHLALNAARLPTARVREHQVGGHQFEGLAGTIAAELFGPG